MYLQELKELYKYEKSENKKKQIKNLIDKKILDSQQQWYESVNIIKRTDLFTRMLAEVEGIEGIDNNNIEIERAYDEKFDKINKINIKKLGLRKDII